MYLPIELGYTFRIKGNSVWQYCSETYETQQWPYVFLETIIVPIKKKKNAMKCEEYETISLISLAAKILLGMLNRRLHGIIHRNILKGSSVFDTAKESGVLLNGFIGSAKEERIRLERKQLDKLTSNKYLNQRVNVRVGEETNENSIFERRVR